MSCFCFYRQIFFYSRSIFKGAKIPQDYIQFAVIGTNAVNVIMTFVAVNIKEFFSNDEVGLIVIAFV